MICLHSVVLIVLPLPRQEIVSRPTPLMVNNTLSPKPFTCETRKLYKPKYLTGAKVRS